MELALVPQRAHPRAAGGGGRLPLRLGPVQRRPAVLRALPGRARPRGAVHEDLPGRALSGQPRLREPARLRRHAQHGPARAARRGPPGADDRRRPRALVGAGRAGGGDPRVPRPGDRHGRRAADAPARHRPLVAPAPPAATVTTPELHLLDYRRRVHALYARLRADPDRAHGFEAWVAERDELFARHPQSALPPERRESFGGLSYYPHDPCGRVLAEVVPAERRRHDVPSSDGATMSFERIGLGRFTFGDARWELELYWLTR